MAKRRSHSRRAASEESRPSRPRDPLVSPETRHEIFVVVVLLLAVITAFSVVGIAGSVGETISHGLAIAFGWLAFPLPLLLGAVGIVLLFPDRVRMTIGRWVGFVIALIAAAGLSHMWQASAVASAAAGNGHGGGYLGYFVSQPLRSGLGPWAAASILVAVFVVGLLVLFNTTLQSLARQGGIIGRIIDGYRAWRWRRANVATLPPAGEIPGDDGEHDFHAAGAVPGQATPGTAPALTLEPPKMVKRPRRSFSIPLDLLDGTTSLPTSGNIDANKEKIRKTLETFGIPVEMDQVNVGPTVTQFTLKPSEGVRLNQITALSNDLALALAAHPIRIEAPIPGKSLVGIEVPNQAVAIVRLREILAAEAFKTRKSNLTFALGKDVSGQPWVTNIDPMPHLLIAGSTGSGKSVMVNSIIISLLYSNSPDDLKLIMVDPKKVELTLYNKIPHLLTPVITDTTKTINALRWVVSEMDRRYELLQAAGKKNIGSYRQEGGDMPYIVVLIDELADLMTVAANEVEAAIVRLAQMSRAVGIHLVLATQRPSVDVITGLIKANITARIAFTVASQIDSRTILDSSGAEKLLGKGDMLFISSDLSKPKRLQGAFVAEAEVERVVGFLAEQGEPEHITEIVEKQSPALGSSLEDLGDDELLTQAKEVILQTNKASATLLQRRMRIGYARAARILDLLEQQGFVGPVDGAKPREIYGTGSTGIPVPEVPTITDEPEDTVMEETDEPPVEDEIDRP